MGDATRPATTAEPASGAVGVLPGSTTLRRIENATCIGVLATLIVVVAVQVIVRFALYRVLNLPWIDELARVLLVWLTFLGATVVFRDSDHITLDLLYDRLPPALQRTATVLSAVAVAAVLFVFVWAGWPLMVGALGREMPATGLPRLVLEGAVWVAGVLMAFHLVEHTVARWRARPGSRGEVGG